MKPFRIIIEETENDLGVTIEDLETRTTVTIYESEMKDELEGFSYFSICKWAIKLIKPGYQKIVTSEKRSK